jgi:hypothetical protein
VGAPSLIRRLVCSLQLLLSLVSAVFLGSESREIHGHILLSQIRNSLYLKGQVAGTGIGFPFRHLLRLAGLRWRKAEFVSHKECSQFCSKRFRHGDDTSG